MSEAALQFVDRSPARRRTLGLGLILLAVIGAYSGSLHGDFQFDDVTSIGSNALVRGSAGAAGALVAVLAFAPGGSLALRVARSLAQGQGVGFGIARVTPLTERARRP